MTPHRSESPRDELTRVKQNFIAAAHAASPLRAVEKYPFTAVSTTAAAAMAATVVISLPIVGKAGGGLLSSGLALATSVLRAKLTQPPAVNAATPHPAAVPLSSAPAI